MTVSVRSVRFVAALAAAASLAAVALPAGAAGSDNTLTAAEQAAGWVLLFDGTTIAKWRGNNATEVPKNWSVADGAITAAKGPGSDLVSVDEYGDFELSVDFKVAKNGNSGIFYRGVEAKGEPIYHSAPEFQVIDNEGHPDAKNGPDRFCGANYALDPPNPASACKPAGEWNTARLVVQGPHVEHWLNGTKVVEYELWSDKWKGEVAASKFKAWPAYGMAKTGRLGLQAHGDEVAFKNLKIRPLK
jgi:3-keto-disaccharide hydrolase